jgi:hypothetical protein
LCQRAETTLKFPRLSGSLDARQSYSALFGPKGWSEQRSDFSDWCFGVEQFRIWEHYLYQVFAPKYEDMYRHSDDNLRDLGRLFANRLDFAKVLE